jgi:tetratricopeptide (TPR) repeat protein
MTVKRHSIVATIAMVMLGANIAAAQIPEEGLKAEGEHRWRDALAVYEPTVRDHPERADLWIRISDIRAAIGDTPGSLAALYSAVRAAGSDADLFARLSRAYAAANQPKAALAAIQGALALRPEDPRLLKAQAELATWAGDMPLARQSYRSLIAQSQSDATTWLALARVEVWSGRTDAAVHAYKKYASQEPDDLVAWLEWARAESWRGNDAGAVHLLDRVEAQFGDTPAYRQERARVLTRAGRPRQAHALLEPLLSNAPDDYDLNLLQALSFVQSGQPHAAYQTSALVQRLGPERAETAGLERQLRVAFGSLVQPTAAVYVDSDGLRHSRLPVVTSVAMGSLIRIDAGYEREDLRARAASGLEQADGQTTSSVDRGWGGAQITLPPVVFSAHGGRQQSAVRDEWIYDGAATLRVGDAARLTYGHEHGLLTISPRAISLGLIRDLDRMQLTLMPSLRVGIDTEGSLEWLSDDNRRWSLRVAPRVAVVRNQRLNVDVGGSAYLFRVDRDLDHGYYDPRRYEAYAFTLLPYFKISENSGLSVFVEAGVQKDETASHFEPGGSASAELTVGIYRAWVFALAASGTNNNRLDSGAFRGFGASAKLVRRF